MARKTGMWLLAVWTDVDPEVEAEFNEWYDKEHVPERLAVPGFLSGIRYTAVEGEPKYLALYELDDENVLKSDAYMKVSKSPTPWTQKIVKHFRNMARREYRQIFSFGNRPDKDAEFVLTVRLNTPPEHEAEFNEWNNIDHVPALVGVPGVYCARRYVALDGGSPKYLAVYEMNDAKVRNSEAWNKARDSDWTRRMRPNLLDGKSIISRRMGG